METGLEAGFERARALAGNLNQRQIDAVHHINGPVLVLAGAGSGKTRVITHRIAYLIEAGGSRPESILAVTFTNKAAAEMKTRVEALLPSGPRSGSPLVCTFHALCVRILRRDIEALGGPYTRNFTIYDEDDQGRIVKVLRKNLGLEDKTLTDRQALSAISWAKSRSLSPSGYANLSEHARERNQLIARIYKAYADGLRQSNALDFDDLLALTVQLLKHSVEVRSKYHQRFRHVMVDEFQDTNGVQYELTRTIVTGSAQPAVPSNEFWSNRSIFVVGDADQSIYSWRGSDFNIILGFQHDFAGTELIKLEQNYRSTRTILDVANNIIKNNTKRLPKTLYPFEERGPGDPVRYYLGYDGEGEASFVAEKVQEHLRKGPSVRCAVLYRANSQSRLFEEALRRRGIEYNIVGGFSFYERAEVKDIIAYLKLASNLSDDVAFLRIVNRPARGIGKSTTDSLAAVQRDNASSLWTAAEAAIAQPGLLQPRAVKALQQFRGVILSLAEAAQLSTGLGELVKEATLRTGYADMLKEENTLESEARLMNIEELVTAAVEAEKQGEGLRDFIDHAALVSDTDQYKTDARVTLLTMHSAKGLEFPVVFICGVEEGLFPHSRASESESDLEEERRLCYVAVTRAEKNLYVTHAMRRRVYGEEAPTVPSRFLNEIPESLIEDLSPGPSWIKFKELGPYVGGKSEQASGSYRPPASVVKNTSNYKGKTYNSAESVKEFFKRRNYEDKRAKADRAGPDQGYQSSPRAGGAGQEDPASFKVGTRVKHSRYGEGIVIRLEGAGDDAKLTIKFMGFGQKKFVAKYAQLEKLSR